MTPSLTDPGPGVTLGQRPAVAAATFAHGTIEAFITSAAGAGGLVAGPRVAAVAAQLAGSAVVGELTALITQPRGLFTRRPTPALPARLFASPPVRTLFAAAGTVARDPVADRVPDASPTRLETVDAIIAMWAD